jgi:hypothetical protein
MDHPRDFHQHPRSTKRMWTVRPLSQVEEEEDSNMCLSSVSKMRKARSLDFSALRRYDHEDEFSFVASKCSQHDTSFGCRLLPR